MAPFPFVAGEEEDIFCFLCFRQILKTQRFELFCRKFILKKFFFFANTINYVQSNATKYFQNEFCD